MLKAYGFGLSGAGYLASAQDGGVPQSDDTTADLVDAVFRTQLQLAF